MGNDVTGNYVVSVYDWGTINVKQRVVKIRTHSYRWDDVQKHSYEGYDLEEGYSLGNGDWLELTYTTYIEAYGSTPNKLEFSVRGLNENGVEVDMTYNYDLEYEYGTLIIAKPILIHLPAQKLEYDGTEKWIETYNFEVLDGLDDNLSLKLIAVDKTWTDADTVINSKDLSGLNAKFPVRFYVYDKEAEEYVTDMYYVVVVQDGDTQADYDVLTITQRRLVIKVDDFERPYDKTELTYKSYSIYIGSLADGHTFEDQNGVDVNADLIEGSITEIGVATNQIPTYNQGRFKILDANGNLVQEGTNGNYKIIFMTGTLKVTDPN